MQSKAEYLTTAKEINELLYRPIDQVSKSRYNHLIPYSSCNYKLLTSEGNTENTVEFMREWTYEYMYQTKELVKSHFKNLSIKKLCLKTHDFLYNNFHYNLDGYDQKLKSPSCSFYTSEGIDCKSYSIIASSILLNAGFNHYFRRIAYDSKGFSHVYVIVPINQKTNNLKEGYFTIDGTVNFTEEVSFYKKDDLFVEARSNALGSVTELVSGASGGSGGANTINGALQESAAKAIGVLTDVIINAFLNGIYGCDDAAYQQPVVELRLKRELLVPITESLENIAHAISVNNIVRVAHLFNALFKEIDLGIAHLANETAFSQNETCIAETLNIALKYSEQVKKVIDLFYENFKQSYTHLNFRELTIDTNTTDRTMYFVVENSTNPIIASHRFIAISEEEDSYSVQPFFGFESNSYAWVLENKTYLKNTYKDAREKEYEKEITPLISKTKELREKYFIGGQGLYYLEQPIQLEMTDIWLKYDTAYVTFLEKRALAVLQANEASFKAFEDRLKQEIEEENSAKLRKKNKNIIGASITLLGVALIVANVIEKD